MKSTLAIAAMATASILALSSENAHANDALRKQGCSIIERGQGRTEMNGCLIDSSMFLQGRVGWVVTTPDRRQFRIEDDDSNMWRMDGRPAERSQDNRCYQNDRVEVCLVNGTFGATDDLLCEHQKRALKNTFSELVSELARTDMIGPAAKAQMQAGFQARFQEGMASLDRVGHDNVTFGARGPVADDNCVEAFHPVFYHLRDESQHVNRANALPCSITDLGHPPLHAEQCLIKSTRSEGGPNGWIVRTPDRRTFQIGVNPPVLTEINLPVLKGGSAEQTQGGRCYDNKYVAVCVENGASWPAWLP
jgi:hypothetical protein